MNLTVSDLAKAAPAGERPDSKGSPLLSEYAEFPICLLGQHGNPYVTVGFLLSGSYLITSR